MNRLDLEEKTKDELVEIAQTQFKLDVDKRYNEEKLISLILAKAGSVKKRAEVFNGYADENGEFTVPPGGAVIEIQANEYNPYKRPVPLGVNGKFIYAPIEKPISIAAKYLEVLRNAVREETLQRREGGELKTYYNTKLSYPFSILYQNRTDAVQKVAI